MKYWILMADVRESSDKDAPELMKQFDALVSRVNEKFRDSILSPLSITLGDEFQGVLRDLDSVKDIILFMDKELLTAKPYFQLRFVAHYGQIETSLNTETSYGMLGPGLTTARKELNALKKSDEDIQVSGGGSAEAQRMLTLAFRWYRSIYNGWPEKDRQVAHDFLQEKDYKKVAALHKRDVSSMWRKGQTLQVKDLEAARELITLVIDNESFVD